MKFLEENETLFKDEDVLDYNFLPDKLPGRESEIDEISFAIKPLVHDRKPSNLFVFGKHGIGKTACVKYVFNQLEETPVKSIIINCWENTSSFSILQKIAIGVGIPIPRKGISKDELLQILQNKMKNSKGVVVALDEVDKIEEQDILYQIPEFLGNKIALILLTNHREYILKLEGRIKSRLGLNHLEFATYDLDQITNILSERIGYALKPNSISDDMINKISNACYENGDVRIGLFLLLNSGRAAEYDGRLVIEEKDVIKAIDKLAAEFSLGKEDSLNEEEKFVLSCIKKNEGKTSGDVYKYYSNNGGKLSERSFRKYINHLLQLDIIEAKESGKGTRGRTRVLSTKC